MTANDFVLTNVDQGLGTVVGYGDTPLTTSALGEDMRRKPARLLRKQQSVFLELLRNGRIGRGEAYSTLGNEYNLPDFGMVLLMCGGYISERGSFIYLTGQIDVTLIKTRNDSPYIPKLLAYFREMGVDITAAQSLAGNKVKAGGKTVKCSINGIKFETLTLAAKHVGVSSGTVKRRCQSVKWGQYKLE